jgi:hypothetical protein
MSPTYNGKHKVLFDMLSEISILPADK